MPEALFNDLFPLMAVVEGCIGVLFNVFFPFVDV
jgi:hypothetical protein